jgi:hypothetical protein
MDTLSRTLRTLWLALAAFAALAPAAAAQSAQTTLSDVAEKAKQAWLRHDPQALVGQSSSLVLQIPGADPSSALGRDQAVELLRRYLRGAEERGLDVTVIREVEPGKGFVELTRRYVVVGTTELRRETVFLGFRLRGGRWMLAELRSSP